MKNIKIFAVIAFIISFGLIAMAEQKVYKLKPIKGRKSAIIQNEVLGTGMTKYTISLERLQGQTSEIYIPTDAVVLTEGCGYNPPIPSNSVNVNSTKTADGFLFNANGPKNNNIQIHLKKSSSENSSYTLEVNLRQGEKYEFPIYYLPNQYLMVRGSANDYENMIASISNNQYFLESLSYVDDELSKYTSEANLIWWAEAFVGVFQDFVDVEAIGQIVPEVAFNTFSYVSNTNYTTWVEFLCGSFYDLYPIENGQLIVITSEVSCITAASIGKRYLQCAISLCPPTDFDSEEEWEGCVNDCRGGSDDIEPVPHTMDCTDCYNAYVNCKKKCDCDTPDCPCLQNCEGAYNTCCHL